MARRKSKPLSPTIPGKRRNRASLQLSLTTRNNNGRDLPVANHLGEGIKQNRQVASGVVHQEKENAEDGSLHTARRNLN